MIKFIYEREAPTTEHSAVNRIEMEIDDEANRDQLLVHYAEFLRAMGYYVPGELDVIDE